jgi:hypothetical protein
MRPLPFLCTLLFLPHVLSQGQACSAQGGSGVCVDLNTNKCSNGVIVAGLCPGGANIECCLTNWGSCPGNGVCQKDNLPCHGSYAAGECPGPSEIQCCSDAPPPPPGVLGVDVDWQDDYSVSDWQCFVGAGHTYAIIQGVNGGLGPNMGLDADVRNARSAGMKRVGVYIFTSPGTLSDPTEAVKETIDKCAPGNETYDTVWFDIEICNGCWSSAAENEAYILKAVQYAQSRGLQVGIYSSAYMWPQVMGDSTAFHELKLWYANYDGEKSFADFRPFAGWSTPSQKQYDDSLAACPRDADVNWAPTYPF